MTTTHVANGKNVNLSQLVIGLLSHVPAKVEVNTLCDVSQSTLSNDDSIIDVSEFQITLSEEGFSWATDFIPKDKTSQWYSLW